MLKLVERLTSDYLKHYTFYSRDASGNIMAVYEKVETGPIPDPTNDPYPVKLAEQVIYGSDRLGTREVSMNLSSLWGSGAQHVYTRTLGDKRYELKDHLGNVREVVSDRKNAVVASNGTATDFTPDLKAYYNYYAFGMLMPGKYGPGNSTANGGYRYGFNGKEKDNNGEWGLTNYDYGFRIYNPGIARFLSVDPLTKDYPWYTPYQFAGNKPIMFIDVDGLEEGLNIHQKQLELGYFKGTVTAKQLKNFHIGNGIGSLMGLAIGVTGGQILKYAPQIFTTFAPQIAGLGLAAGKYGPDAVSFAAGALGYDGSDLPGNGDELGSLINKGLRVGAAKFYGKFASFKNADRLAAHLKGIDFNKDVFETTLEKGSVLEQWVGKNGVGDYFTLPGEDPTKLGIDLTGRVKKTYILEESANVLQSTTADIEKHKGGATQLFSPDLKSKTKEVKND